MLDFKPPEKREIITTEKGVGKIAEIEEFDRQLSQHFVSKLKVQETLTRKIVSFQANKTVKFSVSTKLYVTK